jgi:hypothetical protein
LAALISARQANGKRSGEMLRIGPAGERYHELQQFHQHEPFLKRTSRFRSASQG